MRAIKLDLDLNIGEIQEIGGDKAHHFIKVVRLKEGEKILALNGDGRKDLLEIVEIKKKTLKVQLLERTSEEAPAYNISVALGKVKKEALDLAIRNCCELGVSNIYVCETTYSQKYELKEDRIKKIINSGLEQSNNLFEPKLHIERLDQLDLSLFDEVIYFSSIKQESSCEFKFSKEKKYLIILGPEAGLSEAEEKILIDKKVTLINLPTPIMRTQTAVACCVGYLIAKS